MNNDDREDQIPAPLADRLRTSANLHSVLVPPQVDQVVLGRAAAHFAVMRRRRALIRNVSWLAAAALVVAATLIGAVIWQSNRFDPADIDRSGHVDILDAFALARRIQQGDSGTVDINGDGAVDKADIDAVAAQAVKLKKGPA